MTMAKEGKQIDRSAIFFYNLCSPNRDLLMPSKSKGTAGKEPNFNLAQVLDILLQKWFPLESKIVLLESDPDDEDDNLKFFDPDLEMKSASSKVLAQGTPIHMDSMPNIQRESTQQPRDVNSSFILELNIPLPKLNLLLAQRS